MALINPFFLMFLWPLTWTITILGIGYGHRVRYDKRVAQYFSVLGDASYPFYLFHLPVFSLIKCSTSPRPRVCSHYRRRRLDSARSLFRQAVQKVGCRYCTAETEALPACCSIAFAPRLIGVALLWPQN